MLARTTFKFSNTLLRTRQAQASAAARGLRDQAYRCSSVAAPSYNEDEDDDEDDFHQPQTAAAATDDDDSNTTTTPLGGQKMDAYKVMNLDRHFHINPKQLKDSYRQLMNQLHPDKHNGQSPAQQDQQRQLASEVTQSYQILKDPHTRAMHLLQLMGKIEDMDETLMGELLGNDGNMLLMEVMEIREAIEEASSEEELQPLLDENSTKMQDVCNQLADAFETEDLDKALELTVTLQYFSRIDQTIREKMDHTWR